MARKKHHEEHHEEHPDETWLVPYADILTLLLALFIVLFASSSVDKGKFEQMRASFSDAFGSISYDGPTGAIGTFMEDAAGLALNEHIGLGSDSRGANIDIATITLFEEGSARIKEEAKSILRQVVILLSSDRYKRFKIVVEGHTDDVDFSNSLYPSNWELSAARAAAVVNELTKIGIDKNRIKAIGMAGISPAYPNYDVYGNPIPDNRRRNRRIVVRVEP
ncbi:MAG: flagellar motor protein MotB [Lactobacillus sp.]|jgi:chemotaxis protein MotB|nr:flagellar motor protein MotB [Lactobacillus sp.]